MAQVQAKKLTLEVEGIEDTMIMPEIERMNGELAAALIEIQKSMLLIAKLAEQAGKPRVSQLQFDADGNPIAAISSVINEG
jgi:hypothetical protein